MSLVPRHPFLRTQALNRVFDNTAASYKFFWFLAVLELSRTSHGQLSLQEIFVEMAAQAWHPVNLFRLSFDTKDADEKCVDRLQGVLREIAAKESELSDGLRPSSSLVEIRARMQGYARELGFLGDLVPMRFLGPFVNGRLPQGTSRHHINKEIIRIVDELKVGEDAAPYHFTPRREGVILHPQWQAFFVEHAAILRGFVEIGLVRFLQAKNPMVPGLSDKLRMPMARDLGRARSFWEQANQAHIAQRSVPLTNIYTGRSLDGSFAVDHFMPWSYVAHDYIWNTVPTDQSTNSSKGDRIPSVSRYAAGLAELHHFALRSAVKRAASGKPDYQLLSDHMALWRLSGSALLELSVQALCVRMTETLKALEDQAPVEFEPYRG
jgi:hypothetical protein